MNDMTIVEQRPLIKKEVNDSDGSDGGGGDDKNDVKTTNGNNKNNRTILIAVIVVIVLCCCCLSSGIAGYYAYTTTRSVELSPLQPDDVFVPSTDFDSDAPPSGGLGNDILKNDTWNVMSPVAIGLGCDRPVGANSTIEVIQEPDANGVWIEHWAVACESGDTYLFEVEYILDDTGATFNITPLQ